jgi:hypothetical protein
MDPDPDLGGTKTCGSGGSDSGSATLLEILVLTYRIHERNFGGAAPGLGARGTRLEAAKARAPWQCHVTHVRRAKHTHMPKVTL